MREMQINNWCDICLNEEAPQQVRAVGCKTIGVADSEIKPTPYVLDLCEEHHHQVGAMLDALVKVGYPLTFDKTGKSIPPQIVSNPQRKWSTTLPAGQARISQSDRFICPIAGCGKEFARYARIPHIYTTHRHEKRPDPPRVCPECRMQFEPSGMAMHRIRSHGYDPLAEACAGLKLADGLDLKTGQLELLPA